MTLAEAFDLALQRHRAGRLAEAEALYRQILAAQPNHADALHLLGLIAHQTGRHELAVQWICKALAIEPNYPAAHGNIGEAYRALGKSDEAIASYRRALELKPDYEQACYNLGIALRERGQLDEAIAAYRRALHLKPDYLEAHLNLGIALSDRGQFEEAIAEYRRALALQPDLPEAHNNLGNALKDLGRLDEAMAAYHRALELKPDFVEAHINLGNVAKNRGQLEEAVAACRRALALQPDLPETYNNLAIALKDRGQLDEAVAACRQAIRLNPGFPEAHSTLGSLLKDLGQLDDAVAAYRRAVQLQPMDPGIHSNLIYTLHFQPGDAAGSLSEERRSWNRQFGEPLKPFILPHANDPRRERPLRIGYVSPDLRDQVVGRNLLPLFQRHDRRNFEILCYSGVLRPDQMTEEFRRHSQLWRSTVGLGDEALAQMIRQDKVDILVDLTQHMAGNRLPMFARQPAPVQVSFAGYPESAGLETIEYRISDRYLESDSANDETASREQVCLIDSFWCYHPCGLALPVNSLPAQESGRVTFGSLGNLGKVNDRALKLWARALGAVKDSRLLMRSPAGSHRQQTLQALEREGVEAHQVEFVEARPRREYLEFYHRLDIVLDTFPYNGHTTTCDALWMGVPVVSLAGETPVSRAGLSLLTNLGLPELAAHSETEYVNIAENLARDFPRLAQMRATLRNRMENSVLMDAPRFARNIEAAYRSMWERWCANPSSLHRD